MTIILIIFCISCTISFIAGILLETKKTNNYKHANRLFARFQAKQWDLLVLF